MFLHCELLNCLVPIFIYLNNLPFLNSQRAHWVTEQGDISSFRWSSEARQDRSPNRFLVLRVGHSTTAGWHHRKHLAISADIEVHLLTT